MINSSITGRLVWGAFLVIVLSLHPAQAQNSETGIDMPFPLTNGHVRTPPFKVKWHWFLVELTVKTDLPYERWCCIINEDRTMEYPHPSPECAGGPIHRLEVRWTLWDGARLVAHGPSKRNLSESSSCETDVPGRKRFYLGLFHGKRGKMYVLDLELTNYDPAFPMTEAHLLVWPQPEM